VAKRNRNRKQRGPARAPKPDLLVHIGVPSTEEWHAKFGMSLVLMTAHLAAVYGINFGVTNACGSILPILRRNIVRHAQRTKATHLFFVDSDQSFPTDIVPRLLAHDKAVVGCNVATKQFPSTPTARKEGPELYGKPVYSHDKAPPLEKVWRLGTGVLLVRMDVFDLIEEPWFEMRWEPELDSYRGEDWNFCEKLERAGVEIWVDHRLSLEVGHWGTMSFDHTMVPLHPDEYSEGGYDPTQFAGLPATITPSEEKESLGEFLERPVEGFDPDWADGTVPAIPVRVGG
jgi:hypothetical protein